MNTITQTDRRIGRLPLGRVHKLVIRVTANMAQELFANAIERGTSVNEICRQRLLQPTQQKTPPTAQSLAANAVGEVSQTTANDQHPQERYAESTTQHIK